MDSKFLGGALRLLMVVALGSRGAGPLLADDWLRFRGSNGAAVSESADIPLQWDDHTNLAWKLPIHGGGSSSPIVVGTKVFVTYYDGYGLNKDEPGDIKKLQRHLLCANLTDGKLLWDKEILAKQPEDAYRGMLREHGYATSTPVSDGERVYVFFGKSGVFAFDLEGKQLWELPVGAGSGFNGWGSGASPVLAGDMLIVNAAAEDKELIAVDKKTGKRKWHANIAAAYSSWSTPVVVRNEAGKDEIVLSAPQEIWSFDAQTGDLLWFAEGIDDNTICGSLVAKDNVVYAIGGRSGSAVAVKVGGKDDVTQTHTLWKSKSSAYVPSPVLAKDRIFSINEGGVLSCLDGTSGKSVFQKRLAEGKNVYASPVAAGNHLLIVTRKNGTLVLAADGNGDVLAHNKLDDDTDFNASPVAIGNRLLLRSNQALYCIAKGAK
jgi:outer membrane protein assembly factor BamB